MAYTILTVDDSRTIRMIVKKAFKPYDCIMHEAENGMEGLTMAAKVKPDLIVLDITMPVMTGIEMLGKLNEDETLKTIPVIMLTAESGKDNVMQIVKMGVKDYIVKPFKGEQLIERASILLKLTRCMETTETTEDPSEVNYFGFDGDIVTFAMPEKISRAIGAQVETAVKTKTDEMRGTGVNKMIFNLTRIADISMTTIQSIIAAINTCTKSKVQFRLVATPSQAASLKGFHETSGINTHLSIKEAKDSF
jgi:CheY-like chemotaxis protein